MSNRLNPRSLKLGNAGTPLPPAPTSMLVLAALAVLSCAPAVAQQYPSRAIRLLVGSAAGGAVDISARVVGKKLSESLGQPVVIENRIGASGNIALGAVAKSPPDGYTLLMTSSVIALPSLFPNITFNATKDLAPISLVAIGPSLLVSHPSLPVKNVQQLIAFAKVRPKQVVYGSAGFGTLTHLPMELLMSSTGIDMTHVPYKGGSLSIVGLLSGEVHVLFSSLPGALSHVKQQRLRALAVSTAKRSSALPDVPTIAEVAVRGFDTSSWYGIVGPAGIPKPIVDLLSTEAAKIVRSREVREGFVRDGFEPEGTTPAAFAAFIRSEINKYEEIIRRSNIKPVE